MKKIFGLFAFALSVPLGAASAADKITVGSKNFTESYVLAELMAQLIENHTEHNVVRKLGLGGTQICFDSLVSGEIDLYPEYSGTGTLVLLKDPGFPSDDLAELSRVFEDRFDLVWLPGFGFNNSYVLAMDSKTAKGKGISKISHLSSFPNLSAAFSYEFLNREDGFQALSDAYRLHLPKAKAIQHELAYKAIANEKIVLTDAYNTDGELLKYDLVLLKDDRGFFPQYLAAPLVRKQVLERYPNLKNALMKATGAITDEKMRKLNYEVANSGSGYPQVVSHFLVREGLATKSRRATSRLWDQVIRHLFLTGVSVLLAALIGIPLAIMIRKTRRAASLVLGVTGILQTVPSIAMLGFMLPLFGIGVLPALVALFLYGLLPIVRNTYVGLRNVPHGLIEVARGQGLTYGQILRHVELPLSLKTILAGIRTSAVINVGTATLAAFIGAGGLGEPIVTGISLNNTTLILSGAIPAAVLALMVEGGLSLIERYGLPKGVRLGVTLKT